MVDLVGHVEVSFPSILWRADLEDDWRELLRAFDASPTQMVTNLYEDALFTLLLQWRQNKRAFKGNRSLLQLPLLPRDVSTDA